MLAMSENLYKPLAVWPRETNADETEAIADISDDVETFVDDMALGTITEDINNFASDLIWTKRPQKPPKHQLLRWTSSRRTSHS